MNDQTSLKTVPLDPFQPGRVNGIALLARMLVYLLLMALVALLPRWVTEQVNGQLYSEQSLIEHLQLVVLALGLVVLGSGLRIEPWRPLFVVLGFCLLGAIIRESDFWLDRHVADGVWQMIMTVNLIALMVVSWRFRDAVLVAASRLVNSPAFGFLASGALVTIVFSRLFGSTDLWTMVMSENYNRSVKNAVEEVTELAGMLLLLCGIIETRLLAGFFPRRSMHSGQ